MPHDSVSHHKAALRLQARAARRAVPCEARETAATAVADRILALPELARARTVLLYGAMPEEIDPAPLEHELRARGYRMAYPRVADERHLTVHWVDDPATLVVSTFGLREPGPEAAAAPIDGIDVVIVPGIAFDERGHRLGFGGAYYDGLLARLRPETLTVGIAFDEQVVGACPAEEHDRSVDVLVTPTRTVRAATRRP